MRPKAASGTKPRPETRQAASLLLSDVHQVKVLADPLRIRILEELCLAERTTKQVAQRLGEKPTKLYHHVDALERVGLIRLVRTRQNRGTIEKYFLAVARQFRADSRLFSGADVGSKAERDTTQAMIATVLDRTADEMRGLVAQDRGRKQVEEHGVLAHLELQTSRTQGKQLQERLMKLIQSLEGGIQAAGTKRRGTRYRLTIAFYPLDPEG